ncbi:TrbI/VirB10 family protein [Sandaracinobacter neustonicus]|uniref:TrbI/VirB10 family protein n=1 Tax=Sandaracinobacter neustonicus TaxID=1715348 RepID=A0A501XS01_9SPHN|nr:TrbI/VirB10 family protein [Sandaracinobacter neustonicus]TPE63336.1 TrbI/VirB10 family protein [Sandaracinobacter neustonicus]
MSDDPDTVQQEVPPPPAKEDPETLALRAQPPRAIRFRRSVVIGLAAGSSLALMATAWIALRPPTFELISGAPEKAPPPRPPADALQSMPATYEDVPKLGPPLPGDLGRPILEHQRTNAIGMEASGIDQGGNPQADASRQAADRVRLIAERKAVREAVLLVPLRDRAETAPSSTAPVIQQTSQGDISSSQEARATDGKAGFVATRDTGDEINAHPLVPAASPDLIAAGSVIAASLITGINSDTPGLVIAQVTEQVFDSPTGRRLLIPQGARLIGRYDHVVAFGQRRALIVWQRILWPDGSSLRLENVPATDPSGYAGLADKVDFHSWHLLQGAAISTLLGVGGNLTFSGESDLVRAIRESTQQNAARAGDQLTARNLNIQPTITIRPGAEVRLVVHRDLILTPWKQEETGQWRN